jgi:ankyrin repeat protein
MHKYAKYPLLTAIEHCHPEVVSLLISHGAEIDIVKISNNGTALHVAIIGLLLFIGRIL